MEKQHGPWKITSSELKYKNPWIQVREDKVTAPDGTPGLFGVIKIKEGVSVLAIDDQGCVYLTKEFHYALGRESIEVASGGIETGETPLEAAKRELKEELGIDAQEWTELGTTDPLTTFVEKNTFLYLARKLKFGTPKVDSNEIITPVKVKLEKAVEMIMNNEITHGASCVTILKAKHYLDSRQ